MVNKFGESNGFANMIEAIQRKDTSFETMHNYIVFLANSSDIFHKSFVDGFLNKFNEVVEQKIQAADEN